MCHVTYFNLRLSYLNETFERAFEIENFTLTTEAFPHPHTAVRIPDLVTSILQDFELDEKQVFAVTDGGANKKAACHLADLPWDHCILHGLDLLISKDVMNAPEMKATSNLTRKLKIIYRTLTFQHGRLTEIKDQMNVLYRILPVSAVAVLTETGDGRRLGLI
jgi:hypothetical protein